MQCIRDSTSLILIKKNIDKVYVSKNSSKVHFHLEGVGANKLSVQFVLSDNGIFPKYTYSSLFYHREIQPISSEIKIICENCLRYIISVIFYLINFQENQNKVVKNVEYENYLKKLSPKHLSKPKIQKKLKNKSNFQFVFILNFVLRNPLLRVSAKRYHSA